MTVGPSAISPVDLKDYDRPAEEVLTPDSPELKEILLDFFMDADAGFILEDD